MGMAQIDSDGNVTRTRLPRTGSLSDGRAVSNYHRLDSDTLHAEGWRDVVDDPPDYDPETERLRRTGHEYDADGDVVRVVYEVVDRPPPPPDVEGFLRDVPDTLGEDETDALLAAHPLMERSLALGNVKRAWRRLDKAKSEGLVSDADYDALVTLAEQHHIHGPEDG